MKILSKFGYFRHYLKLNDWESIFFYKVLKEKYLQYNQHNFEKRKETQVVLMNSILYLWQVRINRNLCGIDWIIVLNFLLPLCDRLYIHTLCHMIFAVPPGTAYIVSSLPIDSGLTHRIILNNKMCFNYGPLPGKSTRQVIDTPLAQVSKLEDT